MKILDGEKKQSSDRTERSRVEVTPKRYDKILLMSNTPSSGDISKKFFFQHILIDICIYTNIE